MEKKIRRLRIIAKIFLKQKRNFETHKGSLNWAFLCKNCATKSSFYDAILCYKMALSISKAILAPYETVLLIPIWIFLQTTKPRQFGPPQVNVSAT